jgi:hypothetical protein
MREFLIGLLLTLTLAGCASHTGVVPDGQGGYTISKQAATGFPGLGTLKGDIMQEASQSISTKA